MLPDGSQFPRPTMQDIGSGDPLLPWRKRSTTRRAQRSERQAAKNEKGGKTTPMSGAGRQKGDVVSDGWRTEDKTRSADSFRLSLETWLKIEREAATVSPRRMPKMRITMGKGANKRTLHVIRDEDFLALGLGDLDAS